MAEIAQATGGNPIEIWFSDEARVGQKTTITRRWAHRATCPSVRKDQRTASADIFGAICRARLTTEAMSLHLE